MASLEEALRVRRQRPFTSTFFFNGKSKEMFIFLFGGEHWKNERYTGLTYRTDFDFTRVLPPLEEIKERREAIWKLNNLEFDNEDDRKKLWSEVNSRPVIEESLWNISKWGVHDLRDIHVRYGYTSLEGETYLKVMFMGMYAIPYVLLMELTSIGIQYDLYWVNETSREYGCVSTTTRETSAFHESHGKASSLELFYQTVFEHDLSEIYDTRQVALEARDAFTRTKEALDEWLIHHPREEWEDHKARIYQLNDNLRENFTKIDTLLDYIDAGHVATRNHLWDLDLAIANLMKELNREGGDYGYVYHHLRTYLRYGFETTEKVLTAV